MPGGRAAERLKGRAKRRARGRAMGSHRGTCQRDALRNVLGTSVYPVKILMLDIRLSDLDT
eukprot:1265939-Pyramimonas_sp.AAC.1